MIAADGSTHDSQDDPDLLWGCRGGGTAGLGIVTALEFATHPAPKALHSFRYRYRLRTPEAFVARAQRWAGLVHDLPPEIYSAYVANGTTVTVLVTSFLERAQDPRIAATLDQFAAEATRVEQPRSDPLLAGIRRYSGLKGPVYFKNASGGFYQTIDEMGEAAGAIFEAVLKQPGTIFQINTFGPFPKAGEGAFPHRGFPLIGELQTYWEKPAAEARALKTMEQLQQTLATAGVHAHYANYPDVNLQDWELAYYGKTNYARLQAIKKRYDPANLFRHPQSVRA
jgi:FAD/FMN-containing dehydrogenase